ncbi:MFS transporter [Aquisalimonas sp. 2447]|uniref:MFS transporter n=1 Tax=Aquisalimonas sp. 2447 TaxID=2740807 RepID=UPI001432472E|nr:MFS transporter [Aquisalimonas sp. 2447]QIT55264.1 MFS transporter [Aquisalimonas sp. 2447]
MSTTTVPREKTNVAILASSQALFLIAAITVMTLSGVVGQQLTPDPALATLPVALMQVGTLLATFPASMLMKRIGRRPGFLIGTTVGGAAGGGLAAIGVAQESFLLFSLGNLLLGIYQAFAMYYRFAAADCASDTFRSKAISLVMAGGVLAAIFGPWNANYGQALWGAHPEAGPYLIVMALAVVATVLIGLLQVPAASEPGGAKPQRGLPEIVTQSKFVVALLAAAIGYAVMILVMTATPLAMRQSGFEMGQAAFVMQWHVLGMFAPSFFTGSLIARFGVLNILLTGGVILLLSVAVAVSGDTLPQYWAALVLLGVGWNFLFIGGSTLLTETHTAEERGKVQGMNDLVVFGLVALGSLMAGALLHHLGWVGLNLTVLPFIAVTLLATAWLRFGTPKRAESLETKT